MAVVYLLLAVLALATTPTNGQTTNTQTTTQTQDPSPMTTDPTIDPTPSDAPATDPPPRSEFPFPDLCINGSVGTLSGIYTADNPEDALLLPNLVTNPPGCPKFQAPWWAGKTRMHTVSQLVYQLSNTIQQEMVSGNGQNTHYGKSYGKRRKRRAVTSQSNIISCESKNTITPSGTIRICGVCSVVTRFPPNCFPTYINEVTCEGTTPNTIDGTATCLTSEGSCVQHITEITVRQVVAAGVVKEVPYQQRTACSCEFFMNSVLVGLNP